MTAFVRLPNVSMVFLLAVLFAAARFGLWPALLASGLSFLAYNFFFIEPLHTFAVAEPHEWLALSVLLVVAVLTSAIAGRARDQARTALERARLAEEVNAVRAAAEAERVRNTLLASISHDFRTPLASILGAATSLIDYGARLPEAARRDLLAQVKDEAEHLDGMVRNLLAMTRVEAGGLEINRDWVDIRELFDRAVALAKRRGAAQHFEVAVEPELPFAAADPILLDQVLANVIGNAVRYAGPAARILLEARADADAVILAVTDDGPGIPPAVLPHVFEKFVRALRPAGDAGEGSGLGLASQGHRRGPSRLDCRCKSRRDRARDAIRDPAAATGGAAMSGLTRVLVVDDEPAIHRFLTPALVANDYEVLRAETGDEALRRIAAEAPDVIVLDLGLPDVDGKDVIARVREWSDVPIVVLSARDREAEKIAALDRGADDFVNKPFGVGELMARLRAALRHRMQRAGETPIVRIDGLEIDVPRRRVCREGREIRLTPKEFELLALLARHAGKVVTHKQLLHAVWGPAHEEDTQYLRVYVGQLRQKVEADQSEPAVILTEPGIGYRLAEPRDSIMPAPS